MAALVVAMGIVHAEVPATGCVEDRRCNAIRNLFLKYRSPLVGDAVTFLAVADRHKLDWRLLPSIAIIESGGGRAGGNIFGWNSGRTRFRSINESIEFVASRLATSPVYAGKTATGILERYNPARTVYPGKVIRVMHQMSLEPVE
jgi:hypothetical protein